MGVLIDILDKAACRGGDIPNAVKEETTELMEPRWGGERFDWTLTREGPETSIRVRSIPDVRPFSSPSLSIFESSILNFSSELWVEVQPSRARFLSGLCIKFCISRNNPALTEQRPYAPREDDAYQLLHRTSATDSLGRTSATKGCWP